MFLQTSYVGYLKQLYQVWYCPALLECWCHGNVPGLPTTCQLVQRRWIPGAAVWSCAQ